MAKMKVIKEKEDIEVNVSSSRDSNSNEDVNGTLTGPVSKDKRPHEELVEPVFIVTKEGLGSLNKLISVTQAAIELEVMDYKRAFEKLLKTITSSIRPQ